MACTPKTLRRLVPLLRQELRSASSSNLYSPEHDSRTRYVDHTVKRPVSNLACCNLA